MRRALSGLATPASRTPEDRFKPLRRNDLQDPSLSAGDLCQPSGPDGEGQAKGQARSARGERVSGEPRRAYSRRQVIRPSDGGPTGHEPVAFVPGNSGAQP